MNQNDLMAYHEHCSNHRIEIENSQFCGCFYCQRIFKPDQIMEWIDELGNPSATALCPYCGIDSVIGDAGKMTISIEFLDEMHQFWFQNPRPFHQ